MSASSRNGFQLTEVFWREFVSRYWERSPTVLHGLYPRPLLSQAELFRTTLRAAARFRKGDLSPTSIRFYSRQGVREPTNFRFLPQPGDRGFDRYADRLRTREGCRRFGLIVQDIQSYEPRLFVRITEFLEGLCRLVGIPWGGCTVNAWIGNYAQTPFGVHRDDSSVFQFVVQGRRVMRLWAEHAWNSTVFDEERYKPYRKQAVTLRGNEGDVIYWPASMWHVGESTDRFISLSLAVRTRGNFFARTVAGIIAERFLAHLGNGIPGSAGSWKLPASPCLRQLSSDVRQLLQAIHRLPPDEALRSSIVTTWLERVSAMGFRKVPFPRQRRPLARADRIVKLCQTPILWLEAMDEKLLCSANGVVIALRASPRVRKVLQRLNERRSLKVGEVCTVRDVRRDPVRDLLQRLYECEAVTKIRRST